VTCEGASKSKSNPITLKSKPSRRLLFLYLHWWNKNTIQVQAVSLSRHPRPQLPTTRACCQLYSTLFTASVTILLPSLLSAYSFSLSFVCYTNCSISLFRFVMPPVFLFSFSLGNHGFMQLSFKNEKNLGLIKVKNLCDWFSES